MQNNSFKKQPGKIQLVYPLLVFFIFWVLLLVISQALFAGFHFTDDHEIISINQQLKGQSLLSVCIERVIGDLDRRFRPLYPFHRVLQVSIMGENWLLWNIYIGLLAIATAYFLFLFARNIDFSQLEAYLLAFFTLVGEQAVIWWRLGPNETIGMFCLSLTLYFLSLSLRSKNRSFYQILFYFFMVITSLAKESFVVIMPALVFLQIWLIMLKQRRSLFSILKEQIAAYFILFCIFISEIIFIQFFTGRLSYVGFTGVKWIYLFRVAFKLSTVGGIGIGLIIILALLFYLIKKQPQTKGIRFFQIELTLPFIFFLLLVLPQMVLHIKSGIHERYLVPGIFGYVLLMIYLSDFINKNELEFKLNNLQEVFIKRTILITSGLFFIFGLLNLLCPPFSQLLLKIISVIKAVPVQGQWLIKMEYLSWDWIIIGVLLMLSLMLIKGIQVLKICSVIFLILMIINLKTAFIEARNYAFQGRQINQWLKSMEKNIDREDLIVLVADPIKYYEWTYSLKVYLENKLAVKKIFFLPTRETEQESAVIYFNEDGRMFKNIDDHSKVEAVLIFPGEEEKFLRDEKLSLSNSLFKRFENESGYISYYKRK